MKENNLPDTSQTTQKNNPDMEIEEEFEINDSKKGSKKDHGGPLPRNEVFLEESTIYLLLINSLKSLYQKIKNNKRKMMKRNMSKKK